MGYKKKLSHVYVIAFLIDLKLLIILQQLQT